MLIQNLFDFNHGTCGHQRLTDLLLRETTEHVHIQDMGPCYMYILDYTEDPHELRSLQCKNKSNQIKYLRVRFASFTSCHNPNA